MMMQFAVSIFFLNLNNCVKQIIENSNEESDNIVIE